MFLRDIFKTLRTVISAVQSLDSFFTAQCFTSKERLLTFLRNSTIYRLK